MEELQGYNFVIKHKARIHDKVADGLRCKVSLLSVMQVRVEGFKQLQELYKRDNEFGEIWFECVCTIIRYKTTIFTMDICSRGANYAFLIALYSCG